jgi:hypothetical protein
MITDAVSPASFASTEAIHTANPQLRTRLPDYAIALEESLAFDVHEGAADGDGGCGVVEDEVLPRVARISPMRAPVANSRSTMLASRWCGADRICPVPVPAAYGWRTGRW